MAECARHEITVANRRVESHVSVISGLFLDRKMISIKGGRITNLYTFATERSNNQLPAFLYETAIDQKAMTF